MCNQHLSPLILFPGLAADATIFAPQILEFPRLIVPSWPTPTAGESLDRYSRRVADQLQCHRRAVIGGASFGGIMALHVAQHLDPAAVVLIGSARSPRELPWIARATRPLACLVPWLPVRPIQWLTTPLTTKRARRVLPEYSGLARQFCRSNSWLFRWSLAELLRWDTEPILNCPVHHIHGDRDPILPRRCVHPDVVVPGGGHVLSLSHRRSVNDFIASVLSEVGTRP